MNTLSLFIVLLIAAYHDPMLAKPKTAEDYRVDLSTLSRDELLEKASHAMVERDKAEAESRQRIEAAKGQFSKIRELKAKLDQEKKTAGIANASVKREVNKALAAEKEQRLALQKKIDQLLLPPKPYSKLFTSEALGEGRIAAETLQRIVSSLKVGLTHKQYLDMLVDAQFAIDRYAAALPETARDMSPFAGLLKVLDMLKTAEKAWRSETLSNVLRGHEEEVIDFHKTREALWELATLSCEANMRIIRMLESDQKEKATGRAADGH